jgi:two-component system response regulator DesR
VLRHVVFANYQVRKTNYCLPMPIRVVIAEDQSLVLGALAALLEIERDIRVVGQARNGREALSLIAQHKPDLLLTDIEMPEMSGLEVAAELKRQSAATRVIILTTFARAGYLRRALDAGASGYLLKDSPAASLADAIRRVHSGGRAIDPELAAEAWTDADPLSDRERQVLRQAADGATSAEIAASLHLSEGTVRNYLSEAISKLGAGNRVEAARLARMKGWL